MNKTMDTYVVDTHSLIWFIAEDSRLSKKSNEILEKAEKGEIDVLVPTLVLAEIAYIASRKRVRVTLNKILECIQKGDGFVIVPFDFQVFQISLDMPERWEIHDKIIAATARCYNAELITKDTALQKSNEIKTVW
jgi:predicted nucleic acid-binding protein